MQVNPIYFVVPKKDITLQTASETIFEIAFISKTRFKMFSAARCFVGLYLFL
jgi:hypothetical protein